MAEVILLEGYVTPSRGAKSHSGRASKKQLGGTMSKAARKAKFKAAAKACKGRKIRAFRACMRERLKK